MPDPEPKPDDKPEPKPKDEPNDELEKWKALAKKHEARAKENADAAQKLAALEEADKTELQKAADKAAEAEKRAEAAEARTLRLEVASEKGLTAAMARRLAGTTREELEADADELLTSFKPAEGNGDKPPGKPTESLKGGGDPTGNEPEPDMRQIVADIPRGF